MNPRSQNPYVGPRAFQDGEILYGRDREVSKLLNLLIAERIVLLYSPSGAGKTSLIQAALIPELREEGFRVLPVIRVGMEPPPDLELPATTNRYILSTLLSLEEGLPLEQQTPLEEVAGMDLSSYLDQRSTEDGETDGDVLIFDQFEEILTVDPTDQKAKAEFFAQLGKALRSRDRWVLFAMREEYPAGLDPYLRPVPTRLSTTFRLELLGIKATRQAMQEPARQAGVPFTDTAAMKLIDDLRRVQVQQPDGSTAERPGLYIEPVQLQVVCYRLWENLPDGATEIRETDIREAGDVDSALAGYYADRVKVIAENTGVRERIIREWVDKQLITEQGIRGQVLRGPEQSQGLANKAIEPLVDAHLLRAENRRGATWYELAHDRLIKPVKEDNVDWRETHLSALQRQATLWDSQSRSNGLLLRDDALVAAEAWVKSHDDELIPIERGFLAACREARTQAQKERQKNFLIRWLAIIAMIISVVAGLFFLDARNKAEDARLAEERAKIEAENARMAEKKAKNEADRALKAKDEAEQAKAKAERQSVISLTRALSFQALQQQEDYQNTRAALLARQAYLLNQKYQGGGLSQIDRALRSVLDALHFKFIVRGHEDIVFSVAFSPDGQTLASGSGDSTVRLWDLTDPDAAPTILRGHGSVVRSVVFSPDGRMLASGSDDTTVRLWDLTNPDAAPTILRGHDALVFSVAFSPDGQRLASGSWDTTVRLWDLTTFNVAPKTLRGHEDMVFSVAFSPDGQRLASGSLDKTVRLWDLTNLDAAPTILRGHDTPVSSVAFSPDGQRLASGSGKIIRLWDLTRLDTVPTILLRGHNQAIRSVAFSPDGQRLASGSGDKTVRLWDLTNPDVAPTILPGHEAEVSSVAFSPDGQILASGSGDSTVRLWDLTISDTAPKTLRGHEAEVRSVAFSSDGQRLASGSGKTVWLWDLTNPDVAPTILPDHDELVFSVAFSPDGQTLASGSGDKTVRLWDLTDSDMAPKTLRGHEAEVWSVAFSPDGQTLASGSYDRTVRLWDLTNPDAAPTILRGYEAEVYSVAFSLDGQTLASGSGDSTVRLWDLTNPDIAPTILPGHDELVFSVAFSPDGQTLASGSYDRTVRLWDLTNPDAAPTILSGHDTLVSSVAFSPDGQTLASGSEDTTVRLWDLTNPDAAPIVLRGHEAEVFSVAFSPDGQTLASGSGDKTVRSWDWRTERLAEQVCEKVWRNLTMEEWRQFVSPDIPYERTCLNLPIHPSFLEEGRNLAKENDVEGAMVIFQRALELESGLDLDPQVEVNKWIALAKGEQLAKEGNVEGAVTIFQQALALDSGVDGSSQTTVREWGGQLLIESGAQLVKQEKIQEAIAAYTEAQMLDPTLKIPPWYWDSLCWRGSLWGHATEVMDACEQAVALDPRPIRRNSRGLARALTGDIDGAIEDFQVVVDWLKRQEGIRQMRLTERERQEALSERQQWLEALRVGENPFTPEVLERLRNE